MIPQIAFILGWETVAAACTKFISSDKLERVPDPDLTQIEHTFFQERSGNIWPSRPGAPNLHTKLIHHGPEVSTVSSEGMQ